MKVYCAEVSPKNQLTEMHWFETREEADQYAADSAHPTEVYEVEDPGCEVLVGGSYYQPAEACEKPGVALVDDGYPICQKHLEERSDPEDYFDFNE